MQLAPRELFMVKYDAGLGTILSEHNFSSPHRIVEFIHIHLSKGLPSDRSDHPEVYI